MYENEEVDDDEAKNLAKELNAIFLRTSAKSSIKIEELFIEIGKKFLNPNSGITTNDNKSNNKSNIEKNSNKADKGNEIKKLKDELNKYKKLNDELIKNINTLKLELENDEKINKKLSKEIDSLKDQLNIFKTFNDKIKIEINELKEKNKKLDNELTKANKLLCNFNNNKKNSQEKNDSKKINDFNEIIKMKDNEINNLKNRLKTIGKDEKKLVEFDNIIFVNFISSDQIINFGIKCLKTDTFAEVEEKLYQEYEEYRETNNNFLANGRLILRFKKLCEIGIKDGDKIQLIKID